MNRKVYKPVSPCGRNCPKRDSNCHAKCERYKNFENELIQYREWCAEQKRIKDTEIDGIRRVQRSRSTNGIRLGSRRK